MQDRRQFLKSAALGAACLAAPEAALKRLKAQTAEARIEILLEEPIAGLRRRSTATLWSIWAAWCTTACGSGRNPRSPIRAVCARNWWRRCARSGRERSAGRAAVSRTNTTGRTGSAPARSGPGGPASGRRRRSGPRRCTGAARNVRAERVRGHRIRAVLQADRRAALLRRQCEEPARAGFARWWSTAMRPRFGEPCRAAGGRRRARSAQRAVLGRGVTRAGDAAATSCGGLCQRVSPLHGVAAELTRSPGVDRLGAEFGQSGMDAAVLQEGGRRRVLGGMWGWGLHHYSWNASGGRTSDWVKGSASAALRRGTIL